MSIVFWISLFVIFYAYAGYAIILTLATMHKKKSSQEHFEYLPNVSMIIAAYNEEKVIRKKIEETLNLDYPREKIEIIIASDASTDKTDEIVKFFKKNGIKLIRQSERKGKTGAQNAAVRESKGDILVFSDATTIYENDALKKLLRNFNDEKIGCVGGREVFIDSEKEISEEASFFWKYELFLRKRESQLKSMIGVSGCIFAIRKELYTHLSDELIEDFVLPLQVISKGYKVYYDEEAIGYEKAARDTKSEFSRKVRIVTGGIVALMAMKHLLNPFKYPLISFQLISHKIFRWIAPAFMMMLFFSNMVLMKNGSAFVILGIMQIAFYLLALSGYLMKKHGKIPKILKLVCHFCIMNFVAIFGIMNYFKCEKKVIWQPVR